MNFLLERVGGGRLGGARITLLRRKGGFSGLCVHSVTQFPHPSKRSSSYIAIFFTFNRLEGQVLARLPSKRVQPDFLEHSSAKRVTSFQDTFKPLTIRAFSTTDDLDADIMETEGHSGYRAAWHGRTSPLGQPSKAAGSFISHLHPLSLGQLRLTFFLIDCYLIVTRFYWTYKVLREILVGRRVVVDASTYLSAIASYPPSSLLANGDAKPYNSRHLSTSASGYSVFQEETHFQCGHSPSTGRESVSYCLIRTLSPS